MVEADGLRGVSAAVLRLSIEECCPVRTGVQVKMGQSDGPVGIPNFFFSRYRFAAAARFSRHSGSLR